MPSTWRTGRVSAHGGIRCAMTLTKRSVAAARQASSPRCYGNSVTRSRRMSNTWPIRPPGKERFVRLKSLGEQYEWPSIQRRIFSQKSVKALPKPRNSAITRSYRMKGTMPKKKITGYRALYFHYLYKMGILPKHRASAGAGAFCFARGFVQDGAHRRRNEAALHAPHRHRRYSFRHISPPLKLGWRL